MSGSTPPFDPALERLVGLPDDHPEVLALQRDPERWAQYVALHEFLAPSELPDEARPDIARARLRAAVKGAWAEQAGAPAPLAAAPRTFQLPPRTSWWQRRWGAVPAWAAAAAGVLIVAALAMPRLARETVRYRGPATIEVVSIGATPVAGGVELRWRAVPGADRYRVSVRGADLQPAIAPVTTTDTVVVIALTGGATGQTPRESRLWSVVALRGSTPIAESRDLPLP